MPIRTPAESHAAFLRAFNAGDAAAVLAYYAPDARVDFPDGRTAVGPEQIAAAMAPFLALKGTMTMDTLYAVEHADTALTRGKWRVTGTSPTDGSPVVMEGSNVEVLRRQPDGTWLCAIDLPFGGNA
ncbi:MAG: nuclear transport factor 2 family protein [Phycisphaerae bacterium]